MKEQVSDKQFPLINFIKKDKEFIELFVNISIKFKRKIFGVRLIYLIERELQHLYRESYNSLLQSGFYSNNQFKKILLLISSSLRKNKKKLFFPENIGVLFVPTISNNLNSMIPILNAIEKDIPCTVLATSRLNKLNEINRSFHLLQFNSEILPERFKYIVYNFPLFLIILITLLKKTNKRAALNLSLTAWIEGAEMEATIKFFNKVFIRNKPLLIIGGRPKRVAPLAFLVAAKANNIPTLFSAHSSTTFNIKPLGYLYDMSLYDFAFVQSYACKKAIISFNKKIKINEIGIDTSSFKLKENSNVKSKGLIRIGVSGHYLTIDNLSWIKELMKLNLTIIIKLHPDGGNKELFIEYLKNAKCNYEIYSHNELSLSEFFDYIDIMIGGFSTSSVEALLVGIPLIGYMSSAEHQYMDYLKPSYYAFKLSSVQAHNQEELLDIIVNIDRNYPDSYFQLLNKNTQTLVEYFPVYRDQIISERIKEIINTQNAHINYKYNSYFF